MSCERKRSEILDFITKQKREEKQRQEEMKVANVDSEEKLKQFKELLCKEYDKEVSKTNLDYFWALGKTRDTKGIHFRSMKNDSSSMIDQYIAYNVDGIFIACVGWSCHIDSIINYYKIGEWPTF